MLITGCGVQHDERSFDGWEPVKNRYATAFQILTLDEQKLVLTFGPGGTSDTLGMYLVGQEPVGIVVPLPPLDRIVVATTTHLPYLAVLGRERSVVGAVHLTEVFNEQITELVRSGQIREVGTANGLDQELLVSLRPQAIFDDPFGKTLRSAVISSIPVIHITEYLEEHPLGRAEWLKVFGVLMGEERLADSLFREIESRYEVAALKATANERRPVVFFGSNWQGQWFAPPANSYMATFITDAGAEYVFSDINEGNITLDLEKVLHKVRRSDHFGMILSKPDSVTALDLAGGETRLEKIKALTIGGFFGNTVTSDLFGQALLEPDVVLKDLSRIFHPEMGDTLPARYFRKVDPAAVDPLRVN